MSRAVHSDDLPMVEIKIPLWLYLEMTEAWHSRALGDLTPGRFEGNVQQVSPSVVEQPGSQEVRVETGEMPLEEMAAVMEGLRSLNGGMPANFVPGGRAKRGAVNPGSAEKPAS